MSFSKDTNSIPVSNARSKSISKFKNLLSYASPISSPSSRYGSEPSSYMANKTFLKRDAGKNEFGEEEGSGSIRDLSRNDGGDVFVDFDDDDDDDGAAGDRPRSPDFSKGLDDPRIIKQVGKHLPGDVERSLEVEGGDITRELYKLSRPERQAGLRRTHSLSSEDLIRHSRRGSSASSVNVPGGFRREFLMNARGASERTSAPNFLTRNFAEFLIIYGQFAGENLENENDLIACNYRPVLRSQVADEETLLLPRNKEDFNVQGTATDTKAYFLLLKAFIGTGVLFLPKAFSNGGLLFSSVLLLSFGALSYWCYLILIKAKVATKVSSFAEIGYTLYGTWLQHLILSSIVLSQVGFVSAYIVFTSENLLAFVSNVLKIEKDNLDVKWFIISQLVLFLPLSLIRDITKLSLLALLANIFIFVGLLTVLYYTFAELFIKNNGSFGSGIEFWVKKDTFSLFIGVAIFAFEGIGLIIPIQESMIQPSHFPKVLLQVIATISLILVCIGSLGYLTFGESVQTVIILNLPQDSPFVIMVQLLYACAILLSTPLQLFPAIRLLELKLFLRTGRNSTMVKWQKNLFRFFAVIVTDLLAIVGGNNLDRFVSFVGCFACIPLVYMYPPILHLKACCGPNQGSNLREQKFLRFTKWVDYTILVVGAIALVYTTYQIVVY